MDKISKQHNILVRATSGIFDYSGQQLIATQKRFVKNCQTCNKPHEKTYGENNEWCENCVPY